MRKPERAPEQPSPREIEVTKWLRARLTETISFLVDVELILENPLLRKLACEYFDENRSPVIIARLLMKAEEERNEKNEKILEIFWASFRRDVMQSDPLMISFYSTYDTPEDWLVLTQAARKANAPESMPDNVEELLIEKWRMYLGRLEREGSSKLFEAVNKAKDAGVPEEVVAQFNVIMN